VDHIAVVPHIPNVDEKVPVLNLLTQGGGVAGTALVTVARLGGKASVVWCVGDDDGGHFIISDFKKEGIDTSHIAVIPGLITPSAYVLVDKVTGKRTIAYHYDPVILAHLAKLDMNWIRDARALYIDGAHEASIKAARVAKDCNVLVVCGTAEYATEYERLFKLVDVFIASIDGARSLTNKSEPIEAAKKILRAGPEIVAVTLGDKGSVCVTRGEVISEPAFRVTVVDTTGAGDVYSGAFTYGLLRDWPLAFVVRFSNAVAAIKCERLGGRSGIPNLTAVEALMKDRGTDIPFQAEEC